MMMRLEDGELYIPTWYFQLEDRDWDNIPDDDEDEDEDEEVTVSFPNTDFDDDDDDDYYDDEDDRLDYD